MRTQIMRMALLASAAVAATTGVASASPSAGAGPASEIAAQLAAVPGGTQVSDNVIVWRGGNVVMSFPDPGQEYAPAGLGRNVRPDALRAAGAEWLNTAGPRDVHGCQSGEGIKDAYCFYTDRDFQGRRLQFFETCSDNAYNWGFEHKTSSWVATDIDKTIYTYDVVDVDQDDYLWREPENSQSSYVGDNVNDDMVSWMCGK